MQKLVILLVALAACKKEDKPKQEAPAQAQPDDPKPVEPKPTPTPTPNEEPAEVPIDAAEEAPTAGDGGKCTVYATVGREFKQVSSGGPTAAKVYQWETPETRKEKGYKDEGFTLNCDGSDVKLSITSVAAIPFSGVKQYKVGEDTAQVEVSGTLGNTRIAKATGALAIDKFDEKRLTGRLTTYISETVPPGEMIRIVADFDFTCSGLSGCK
ncbi:MAG: hypothetical protein SFX73_18690 [Kofleriaceae bacterium]|nr:hypothetical protein [Kofleriaceae bacterium]